MLLHFRYDIRLSSFSAVIKHGLSSVLPIIKGANAAIQKSVGEVIEMDEISSSGIRDLTLMDSGEHGEPGYEYCMMHRSCNSSPTRTHD